MYDPFKLPQCTPDDAMGHAVELMEYLQTKPDPNTLARGIPIGVPLRRLWEMLDEQVGNASEPKG